MRRWIPLALVTALLTFATSSLLSIGQTAGAQDRPAPTTTLVPVDQQPVNSPSIIPMPNSSSQPTQYVVMVAILGGLGLIVLLVVRESRKHRDRRTPTPS